MMKIHQLQHHALYVHPAKEDQVTIFPRAFVTTCIISMSIFEEHRWLIPLPGDSYATPSTASLNNNDSNNSSNNKRGKVWSNRNYGADK